MKLAEIADRITAYLNKWEADPVINAPRLYACSRGRESLLQPYYHAGAYASGRYVGIRYVSYQATTRITKEEALKYLAMLDSGYVGRHFEAFRNGSPA